MSLWTGRMDICPICNCSCRTLSFDGANSENTSSRFVLAVYRRNSNPPLSLNCGKLSVIIFLKMHGACDLVRIRNSNLHPESCVVELIQFFICHRSLLLITIGTTAKLLCPGTGTRLLSLDRLFLCDYIAGCTHGHYTC